MRYEDLLSLVMTSTAADWVRMDEPVSLARVMLSGFEGSPEVWIEEHSHLAYHRENLDISLAWGADQNDGEPWSGVWADWSHFPDRTVRGRYIEVLWRGKPVYRQLIVSADGGRYYLPAPNPRSSNESGDAAVSYYIEKEDIPLARLAHELSRNSESFDSGISRTGAAII